MQKTPHGYRVQLVDPLRQDRRINVSGRTKQEVEQSVEEIRRLRRRMRRGLIHPSEARAEMVLETQGVLTFAECWHAYAANKTRQWKKQLDSIWTHRLKRFHRATVYEMDEPAMRDWEESQAKDLSPATIANAYDCAAAAIRRHIPRRLSELPWGKWRPTWQKPDEREACRSVDELDRLLCAANEHDDRGGDLRDLTARMGLICLAGLRNAEAAALRWSDLRLLHDGIRGRLILRVSRSVIDGWRAEHPEWSAPEDPTKSRRAREVVLHAVAIRLLQEQRARLEALGIYRPDGPIFPNLTGDFRCRICVRPEIWRAVVVRAGLPNPDRWVTHSGRHSFATLEAAGSGNLKDIQERLGHANLTQTANYLHRGGRGLPEPAIGKLRSFAGAELAPPRAEVAEAPLDLGPAEAPRAVVPAELFCPPYSGDIETVGPSPEERRAAQRVYAERHLGREIDDMLGWFESWTRAGRRTKAPPELEAAARRHYQRAYAEAVRASDGDKAAAQKAGMRAKRGLLGAWGRFWRAEDRRRAAEAGASAPLELAAE